MAKKKSTKAKKESTIRTPIVAVMGHVDHGKTTLLDTIRGSRVVDKEEGGITQNTRAHQVELESGNKITFIDTPGHEAFGAMRERGAEVTDFVLLVVAADDGVQDQTKQSIKFAKESKTPIVVAINKIDLDGVKLDKIKRELSDFGVVLEEYGGEVLSFEVSALKNKGVKELIEGLELLAEIHELKPTATEKDSASQAYVLESNRDKHLGPVALCISKAGELNKASYGATSTQYFKTRSYLDQDQKQTKLVQESDPFWVTGLKETLDIGETIFFYETEQEAKDAQEKLKESLEQVEEEVALDPTQFLLQKLLQKEAQKQGVEQKTLNVIIKASTQGTMEAVLHEIDKLGDEEKKINILSSGTGEITESEVRMARTSGAIVISFQLKPSSKINSLAKQEKVVIRNYEIIYEMIEELEVVLESLITPEEAEVEVARAKIKQIFTLSDGTIVAGCEVTNGTIVKGYQVYIERPRLSSKDEIAEIGRGKASSLRLLKEEVREVKKGQECGIVITPQTMELETGDEIVAFKIDK